MEALLIVDVQNDFCPGGSLAVPHGDLVVAPLNNMMAFAKANRMLTLASRDRHPRKTNHFAEFGGKWPVHCVQFTRGEAFHPDLKLPSGAYRTFILSKGTQKNEDAYSAFQGRESSRGRTHIGLDEILREYGVRKIYVGGLATDYCVKETVLDALRLGYEVVVLEDAIRGVEVNVGDTARAIQEMRSAGALFTTTDAIINFIV